MKSILHLSCLLLFVFAGTTAVLAQLPPDINIAQIENTLRGVYGKYQSGKAQAPARFRVDVAFRIGADGSISGERITRSSGSRVVDTDALAILRSVGQSHVLRGLSDLKSTTATVDVTDTTIRLAAGGIAPTASEARAKADFLRSLVNLARASQRGGNPAVSDMLGLIRITSTNNRMDVEMTGPRQRVSEVVRRWYERSGR